jgi:hypothetical protein
MRYFYNRSPSLSSLGIPDARARRADPALWNNRCCFTNNEPGTTSCKCRNMPNMPESDHAIDRAVHHHWRNPNPVLKGDTPKFDWTEDFHALFHL